MATAPCHRLSYTRRSACTHTLPLFLLVSLIALGAVPAWGQEPSQTARSADAAAQLPSDRPFAKGTWTLHSFVSSVVGDSDHGYISAAHLGFGYHFRDDLSINLEGFGGWVDSKLDDDGGIGGFDLLLRWHFLNADRGSLYLDGGVGFQQATTNFPSDSHHNFRPQFGVGGTLRLADQWRLMGGVRYLHVSNAATTEGNDGGDWAMLYLGLMRTF